MDVDSYLSGSYRRELVMDDMEDCISPYNDDSCSDRTA